jgi:hypothetical protein
MDNNESVAALMEWIGEVSGRSIELEVEPDDIMITAYTKRRCKRKVAWGCGQGATFEEAVKDLVDNEL